MFFLTHHIYQTHFRLYFINASFDYNNVIAEEKCRRWNENSSDGGLYWNWPHCIQAGMSQNLHQMFNVHVDVVCERTVKVSVCCRRTSLAPSFWHLKVIGKWFSFVLWRALKNVVTEGKRERKRKRERLQPNGTVLLNDKRAFFEWLVQTHRLQSRCLAVECFASREMYEFCISRYLILAHKDWIARTGLCLWSIAHPSVNMCFHLTLMWLGICLCLCDDMLQRRYLEC